MITPVPAYKISMNYNVQQKKSDASFTQIKLSKYNLAVLGGLIAALCINQALWDLDKAHIITAFTDKILTVCDILAYSIFILACNKFMKH